MKNVLGKIDLNSLCNLNSKILIYVVLKSTSPNSFKVTAALALALLKEWRLTSIECIYAAMFNAGYFFARYFIYLLINNLEHL